MLKSFAPLFPAIMLLLLSISVVLVASLYPNEKSKELAVLLPFKNSFLQNIEIVARTGVPIIREGSGDSLLIVANTTSHTKELLYDNGALLVFDPTILGNCLAKTQLK